jgi:EmrB/QacA subfamily drug resistance transporter
VDYANWRTIFYINVPIGILNLFLASVNLKETELVKGKDLDKWGIILSSTGFFCLLMALSKAASKGWSAPLIVGLLTVSLISLLSFTIVELRHPEPILDLRLFKNYLFTLSIIISSIISFGLFGAIFLIPIYLQNVLGVSAMTSGLITLPSALASGFMMPIAGRIFDKYGPRPVAVTGLVILTVTTYMMHIFDPMTSFMVIIVILTVRGMGMGLANMPITTAGMNAIPIQMVGRASALGNVIRQVSASFGVAIFTTIWQSREVFHFAQLAQSVNLQSNQAMAIQNWITATATSQGMNSSAVQSLAMGVISKKLALAAMATSLGDCFIVAAALCIVAIVLCLFMKKKEAAPDARTDLAMVVTE